MGDVLDVLDTGGANGRLDASSPAAGAAGAVADDMDRLDAQESVEAGHADGRDLQVMHGTVAALYVDPNGVYANLPGVEVWDEARDARLYAGPWPVVAHPPCARWCRLAGFVESRFGHRRGDDGGRFAAALAAVRQYGGVLEHPADSRAWHTFGLPIPGRHGHWTGSLWDAGWSCYVEQGRYGHPVRKATWLYAVGTALPALKWGRVNDQDAWGGLTWTRSPSEGRPRVANLSLGTPAEFRDVLVGIARSVEAARAA